MTVRDQKNYGELEGENGCIPLWYHSVFVGILSSFLSDIKLRTQTEELLFETCYRN